jgi:hypothetical protein
MPLKRCPRCAKTKPIKAFHVNRFREDGRSAWCKVCDNGTCRVFGKTNHQREKELLITQARDERASSCFTGYYDMGKQSDYSVKVKLGQKMTSIIWRALKRGEPGQRLKSMIGYTINDLKKHLEKRFKPGMSWENYGKWHIDHVVPHTLFKYKKIEDEDFRRCWALKNLQPLWAKDNLFKSGRFKGQFQRGLIF